MAINPDFRDLFAALNNVPARYLLVGGYALVHHGHPRLTMHLDIWVEPQPGNAARVFGALQTFGTPSHDLEVRDLERPGLILQIGVPPNRIDIITAIDGKDRKPISRDDCGTDDQEARVGDLIAEPMPKLVPGLLEKCLPQVSSEGVAAETAGGAELPVGEILLDRAEEA